MVRVCNTMVSRFNNILLLNQIYSFSTRCCLHLACTARLHRADRRPRVDTCFSGTRSADVGLHAYLTGCRRQHGFPGGAHICAGAWSEHCGG